MPSTSTPSRDMTARSVTETCSTVRKVGPPPDHLPYLPADRGQATFPVAPLTVEHLMVLRGLAPSLEAAKKRLRRHAERTAELYQCFLDADAYQRLTRFIEPGERVLDRIPVNDLTLCLEREEAVADGAEDVAHAEHRERQTRESARLWYRRIHEHITHLRRLARAVAYHWDFQE